MSTAQAHNDAANPALATGHTNGTNGLANKELNGSNVNGQDHATATNGAKARRPYDYGGNPLAHVATNDSSYAMPAFGGEFQPGLYREKKSNIGNPAPLGLSAFALTTFVLSLVNLGTRNVAEPNLVVAIAYGYGGLVQLLAGMWEMAVGNTFGATALSSYGGFWISFAIVLTPGGFNIVTALGGGESNAFHDSFGFYLMGWFIFTTLLLVCTLKSTVAFFFLFFTLDLAFLFLGIGYLEHADGGPPNKGCIRAGGAFGILAAFAAWYNALAGIADSTNSFFVIPVAHFPWSATGRERRGKTDRELA